MISFLKKASPLLTACLAIAVFSCNNAEQKPAADKTPDTTAAAQAATPAPAPAPFQPFDVLEITHDVKDYAAWRPAFNADSVARKASGMQDLVVAKNVDNPKSTMVVLKVSDLSKAKAFAADPRLKQVMQKHGVVSKPVMAYYHVIRFNPESKEKQWVTITHKVKDFDTWVKAFDAEAPKRPSFGLVDVALAREVDDPNMVEVVFDIKDMTKARARMKDPELKKIMTDAGVQGTPKITFYETEE